MPTEIVRTESQEIERPARLHLGGLPVSGPAEVLKFGVEIANELSRLIRERKLFSNIQGREYVRVEGWTTAAAMLGFVVREQGVTEDKESGDFTAVVELVRASDATIIGRASALCGGDENPWGKRPRYARRSMAVTRASGKVCRLAFSWIVNIAGFEPTPAEEMPSEPDHAPVAPRREVVANVPALEINQTNEVVDNLLAELLDCLIGMDEKKWGNKSTKDVRGAFIVKAKTAGRKLDEAYLRDCLAEAKKKLADSPSR